VRLTSLPAEPPSRWPKFSSPLRGPALTARVGRVLGIAFAVCFATGLLSHYQYAPWRWLPVPAAPSWGYRLTQGVHVITGIACIPLLLVKLWSVYHRLFAWPPARGLLTALERLSVAVLVSTSLLQLITGFFNVLQFYPWHWDFIAVHYWLAWIVIGSVVLHVAVKLPTIRTGLSTRLGDALPAVDPPAAGRSPTSVPAGPSRRGVLIAAGAGVGIVVVTTAGQVIPQLEPLALLAPRSPRKGPQNVPVNRTAAAAGVISAAQSSQYRLVVDGPRILELSLAEVEAWDAHETVLPIACVEGWSRTAHWRGPRLLDLVERAGGSVRSAVTVRSLERSGYHSSVIRGSQLGHSVLATHLNGERLSLDHGYPLRLIAPDRAGVLQTKWLTRIEVR
jgi:hypothetical protein